MAGAILPSQWCTTFLIGSATTLILTRIAAPPWVYRQLLGYGPGGPTAATTTNAVTADSKAGNSLPQPSWLARLRSASQVPHCWFTHFYATSVLSSIFWGYQLYTHGPAMEYLARRQVLGGGAGSMSLAQVALMWVLLAAQGSRRLYECFFVMKLSQTSQMWIVHWFLGIGLYVSLGIGVWIEGSAGLLDPTAELFWTSLLNWRTAITVPAYVYAAVQQHMCHRQLASLKKYTLPNEGWFRTIVCPHYTFELVIYTAFTFLAAPRGQLINMTVLGGLVFAGAIVTITSRATRDWYIERFGADKATSRWCLIPYVFYLLLDGV